MFALTDHAQHQQMAHRTLTHLTSSTTLAALKSSYYVALAPETPELLQT